MKSPKSALLIAPPGHLRNSLQLLLTAVPQIGLIHQADDLTTALALGAKPPPVVTLLAFTAPSWQLGPTVKQIKSTWPHTQCLLLVDDESQRQQAQTTAADVVIVKGILATKLLAIIETLCQQGCLSL